jgi:hypothetical protein
MKSSAVMASRSSRRRFGHLARTPTLSAGCKAPDRSAWTEPWSRQQLETVLAAYVEHYNSARPHWGLDLGIPVPATREVDPTKPIERVDILGGLIHEDRRAA